MTPPDVGALVEEALTGVPGGERTTIREAVRMLIVEHRAAVERMQGERDDARAALVDIGTAMGATREALALDGDDPAAALALLRQHVLDEYRDCAQRTIDAVARAERAGAERRARLLVLRETLYQPPPPDKMVAEPVTTKRINAQLAESDPLRREIAAARSNGWNLWDWLAEQLDARPADPDKAGET